MNNDAILAAETGWLILGLFSLVWVYLGWLVSLGMAGGVLINALTGAFVASTIWPVAAGLYWRNTNPAGATLAMLAGTTIGLACYFLIGFYVAALVSAAISMSLVVLTTWLAPKPFDWSQLNSAPGTPQGESG